MVYIAIVLAAFLCAPALTMAGGIGLWLGGLWGLIGALALWLLIVAIVRGS